MSSAVELVAERVIDISDADSGSAVLRAVMQYTGPDPRGVGLTVVAATNAGVGAPKNEDMRRLHARRLGKKAFPLVVAVTHEGQTWLTGPGRDTAPIGPIETSQAQRILQAGLDEPDGISGRQHITHLLRSLDANGIPGLANAGLFANHFLTTSAPELTEWEDATAAATPALNLRGNELLGSLGYRIKRATSSALLLSSADNRDALSIAVVLTDEEAFEQSSNRFAVSPVAYGLRLATEHRAPWLIALRGSQIRIYPATPGVGVGSRGQATTYFELDLALLDTKRAGYLGLVFTAEALKPDGLINLLLAGSERYATSLGERLRDRVYAHAVPKLAMAVAKDLDRLGHKDLATAYEVTLRILFRFLFQAYAEDRELLPYGRNDRYTRNSLKKWAQDFVDEPDLIDRLDPASTAMWRDFLQVWEVIDTGNSTWEVPPYNGGLFGAVEELHPHGALISQLKLSDDTVGDAVFHLLVDEMDEGGLGAVDFRSLSVREFGTIYEGLLESELSRTDIDLALNKKDTFVPAKAGDEIVVRAGEVYFHNKSGERKATGSYFTPAFAVQHLIARALVPTLERHLEEVAELLDAGDESGAYRKFFDFRVADLAMGSGHFLVAAIDQIETQMAAFLVDHPIPGVTNELRRLEQAARHALGDDAGDYDIEPQSLLRRQIARRCVYGLDVNPIAVELARVGIWIHTFVPGLPMSSLDHNLVCANSLTGIGTIDEALEALEPDKGRTGTMSLLRDQIEAALIQARDLLARAADSAEATKAEVKKAAEIAKEAAGKTQNVRMLFDAAVAARIGEIDLSDVYGVDAILVAAGVKHVREAVEALDPGHMPYLFPEVFLRPGGGFDVLIGNPPWETVKVDRHKWWSLRVPGLRSMAVGEMNTVVDSLEAERPDLRGAYESDVRSVDSLRNALSKGPFPGLGAGDPDLSEVFAWRYIALVSLIGTVGVVLPRSVFVSAGSRLWREHILTQSVNVEVIHLVNSGEWIFEDVHPQYTIALVSIGPTPHGEDETVSLRGPYRSRAAYQRGIEASSLPIASSDVLRWTPPAAIPLLPDDQSLDTFLTIRAHFGLVSSSQPWDVRVYNELHSTTGKRPLGPIQMVANQPVDAWPVYKGESFSLWTPVTGIVYGWVDADEAIDYIMAKRPRQLRTSNSPFFEADASLDSDRDAQPPMFPRVMWRKVGRATDRRSFYAALIPPRTFSADHNYVLYFVEPSTRELNEAFVVGVFSSLPFDWHARLWVEANFTGQIVKPFPVPGSGRDSEIGRRVVHLSGCLAAVDDRYEDWAAAVGVPVGTLRDEPERSDAIYELDALVSLLYGLSWDQVVHIFETFHRGWDYSERLAAVKKHYEHWEGQA